MFGVSKEIWSGYNRKEKLYVACKKMHILGLAQFFNRKILGNNPTEVEKQEEVVVTTLPVGEETSTVNEEANEFDVMPTISQEEQQWYRMEEFFGKAKNQFYVDIPSNKRKVVFSGHVLEFDKGICAYMNRMEAELEDTEVLLISHATKQIFAKSNSLINCKYFSLPFTFGLNRYETNIAVEVPAEVKKEIEEKEYLTLTAERIRLRHKDMGEGYPMALTWFLYNYYCEFLDYYKPETVILWCEFYCGHNILKDICEEKGIKVLYMEFGALPGTIALENNGQMGESDVATKWEEFKEKPVDEDEIKSAEEILKYLRETGLNRRVQPKTNTLDEFRKMYNPKKPIVVMFGQNDYEAGILPYTETSKKYHSPIFKGSDDAALFVEKLAKKNGWNYIYKPHQMMVRVGECLKDSFSTKTMWVGDSDINELIDIADVVITIVSQCGYVSLIREKPTVMLGYTQLRGKGCAYEAFEEDKVEAVIKQALKKGYTQEQKQAFKKHVAQLLKYYLFDDGLEKALQIGQNPDNAISFVDENVLANKQRTYENLKRRALFFCETEYDVQGAIDIRNAMCHGISADLVIGNSKSSIKENDIRKFAEWNQIVIGSDLDEIFEKLAETEYTDLYVTGYEKNQLSLFDELQKQGNELNVHIFDGGNIKLYLHDVARDVNVSLTKAFLAKLSEIYLYDRDFMVWKDKMNIKIFQMPESGMEYIKYVFSSENEKIYMNGFMMADGYVSNEMDLVSEVDSEKNNMTVIPYCEKSEVLFKNNNYAINNPTQGVAENKGKVIYSTLFNGSYFYAKTCDDCQFVDLSKLVVSGYPVLMSNTYKQFQQICSRKMKQNDSYYIPKSFDELNYISKTLSNEE